MTTSPRRRAEFADLRSVDTRDLLVRIKHQLSQAHVQAFAAALAYGAVFALVPTLALLVLLLGALGATDLVDRAVTELDGVIPDDALVVVDQQLTNVATADNGGAYGIGVVVSVLVALWGASGAVRRLIEALNTVHAVEERRSFVGRLVTSVALAIAGIGTAAVAAAVIVLGEGMAETVFGVLGLDGAAHTWSVLRWPLLMLIAWLAITATYRFAPAGASRGGPFTPGTVLATGTWLAFSVAFSWYLSGIGDLSATWGSVVGIVVLLLYLQYSGLILLIGALVDVQLVASRSPGGPVQRAVRRIRDA